MTMCFDHKWNRDRVCEVCRVSQREYLAGKKQATCKHKFSTDHWQCIFCGMLRRDFESQFQAPNEYVEPEGPPVITFPTRMFQEPNHVQVDENVHTKIEEPLDTFKGVLNEPGITYTSDLKVRCVHAMGNDDDIARIARHDQDGPVDKLLLSLMKNRHGSPFEFGYIVFKCEIPLFVIQQMLRHRIGVSYSQWSLRWDEAPPVMYVPARIRPLMPKDGKQSNVRYNKYEPMVDEKTYFSVSTEMMCAFQYTYNIYKRLLNRGVAQEIARIVLPASQISIIHVAFNPRSLMHFLSLRIDSEANHFPSHPQYEVQRVAEQFATAMARVWPKTYAAFQQTGRIAP